MLELIPKGLLDPIEWSSVSINNIINGRIKCIIKIDLVLD